MDINGFLKWYFKEHKITQQEIVKRIGIEQSKISLMLNGKRKVTAEELVLIAKIFDIDLNKLKEINLG